MNKTLAIIIMFLLVPLSIGSAKIEPIKKYVAPKTYTSKDIYIVATVIWNEARGEDFKGKYAIASVIYNRSNGNASLFSKTVMSKNWLGQPYKEIKIYEDMSHEIKIAKAMFNGRFEPIDNHTHFYNPDKCNPYWKRNLKNKEKIGNHIFGIM